MSTSCVSNNIEIQISPPPVGVLQTPRSGVNNPEMTNTSSPSTVTDSTGEPKVTVKSINMIKNGDTAFVKGAVLKEWLGVVRAEERSHLLRGLIKDGLGTRDVENFISKQRVQKTKECGARGFVKDRELVEGLMKSKLEDSIADEKDRRQRRIAARHRLEHLLRKKRSVYKRHINMVRGKATRLRNKLKKGNKRKTRMIRMSWKEEKRFELPKMLARYKDAKVFSEVEAEEFKPGEIRGPVIVGEDTTLLNADEVAILTRGPKFTVRRVLDRERFILEMEKVFVKLRWALKDRDVEKEVEYETNMTKEEQERIEDIADMEEAKSRMVFDNSTMKVDFRKSRCTDVKHNSKIILPGPLPNILESELEMRRVAWGASYDAHVSNIQDEEGVAEDNLTEQEARGLKSLQKRVKNGQLVIVQTDISSRFAVMTLAEYEEAGKKHTAKDEEVGLEFVMKNETQINGHMSMLLKTFMVGQGWGHEDRTRSTKITHSLSVAPMYILFKDHKGWSVRMGTAPPSRPVASAGGGQNDHFSENVSQLLEPVANTWRGGMEANSTCDVVDKVETMNDKEIPLEDIDLEEVDAEMDRKQEIADSDTLSRHGTLTEPVQIDEKTAKQDLSGQIPRIRFGLSNFEKRFYDKFGKIKAKWGSSNKAAIDILARWEFWDSRGWEIRENLMTWLLERDEGQLAEDAIMMMDNMEQVVGRQEIPEKDMGIILVGAAELFIEVVEARNRECGAYDMMCGGDELCQAQHNCDNISFEVSEDGELCQAQSEETEAVGDRDGKGVLD